MQFSAAAVCCVQDAIKVDAKNPLARFERAAMLEDQGRLQEALHELTALKVPKHACACPPTHGSRLNVLASSCYVGTCGVVYRLVKRDGSLVTSAFWWILQLLMLTVHAAAAGACAAGGQRVLQDGAHASPPQPAGRGRDGTHLLSEAVSTA